MNETHFDGPDLHYGVSSGLPERHAVRRCYVAVDGIRNPRETGVGIWRIRYPGHIAATYGAEFGASVGEVSGVATSAGLGGLQSRIWACRIPPPYRSKWP